MVTHKMKSKQITPDELSHLLLGAGDKARSPLVAALLAEIADYAKRNVPRFLMTWDGPVDVKEGKSAMMSVNRTLEKQKMKIRVRFIGKSDFVGMTEEEFSARYKRN